MESASERAERRSAWPVRRYVLGQEPGNNLSAWTTAEERIEMMWPLALEAWSFSGRPLPRYARTEAPLRCVPLGPTPTPPRPGL
jgi:hypothetical protein